MYAIIMYLAICGFWKAHFLWWFVTGFVSFAFALTVIHGDKWHSSPSGMQHSSAVIYLSALFCLQKPVNSPSTPRNGLRALSSLCNAVPHVCWTKSTTEHAHVKTKIIFLTGKSAASKPARFPYVLAQCVYEIGQDIRVHPWQHEVFLESTCLDNITAGEELINDLLVDGPLKSKKRFVKLFKAMHQDSETHIIVPIRRFACSSWFLFDSTNYMMRRKDS